MCLTLTDASVEIEGRTVLQQLDVTIELGNWVSVIGETGAGKSTFLSVLKGLLPLSGGTYTCMGTKVGVNQKEMPVSIRDIGMVFQYPEKQLFQTTAYKELAFGLKQKRLSKQGINETIRASIQQFGLNEAILKKSPFELSGGQRRRLALASILITNPDILLLDEPAVGLDPKAKKSILQFMKQWQMKGERTVVFISHQMEDVMHYSEEVIVLHQGRMKTQMASDTLFLHHPELLHENGLLLPEAIQLLHYVKQKTNNHMELETASETAIFSAVHDALHVEEEEYG